MGKCAWCGEDGEAAREVRAALAAERKARKDYETRAANLKAKLDAFDEEDRNVVELAFEVSEVQADRDRAQAALADARRVLAALSEAHGGCIVDPACGGCAACDAAALLSAPAPQAEAGLRTMADKLAELSIAGRFALIDEPSAAVERWRTR